jgi:hypothetical protein
MHATQLVRTTTSRGLPPPSPLADEASARFSRSYVAAIRHERPRVAAYASMLVRQTDAPARLDATLLAAESGAFVGHEQEGRALIAGVDALTGRVFAATRPTSAQRFTLLTSSTGAIPIRLGDPGAEPLRVVVALSSTRLRFPDGARRVVTLDGPNQIITFRVQTEGTGQFPVAVTVFSPSGLAVSSTRLIVRSTAFNGVALVVTIGAAVALVVLWARRLVRRARP